jgi:predicted amidohydrolase
MLKHLVAAVQMCTTADLEANLRRARALAEQAVERGAKLVVLPEVFAWRGSRADEPSATTPIPGPVSDFLRRLAADLATVLVGGSFLERAGEGGKSYNTSLVVLPDGTIAARYRKIHLFDVDLPDGTKLLESGATRAGTEPVVAEIAGPKGGLDSGSTGTGPVKLGMTICYDLRFPELYRKLVNEGVRIVTVPAAFTLTTGKDHWHVLLRARAIENQVFVLAPAQHGRHPRGRATYGKSLIVDPWGDVLAQCAEGEGFALAHLNFGAQDRVRASLPCLSHRRM